jgi:hypothetical protein
MEVIYSLSSLIRDNFNVNEQVYIEKKKRLSFERSMFGVVKSSFKLKSFLQHVGILFLHYKKKSFTYHDCCAIFYLRVTLLLDISTASKFSSSAGILKYIHLYFNMCDTATGRPLAVPTKSLGTHEKT